MYKITNEEKFLKHFIDNANEYGEVDITKTFPEDLLPSINTMDFLKVLSKKGYVEYVDFQHYRLTPYGRNAYIPLRKKIIKSIFTGTKVTLREIISFLLGILSAVIIAIALKRLGLN